MIDSPAKMPEMAVADNKPCFIGENSFIFRENPNFIPKECGLATFFRESRKNIFRN